MCPPYLILINRFINIFLRSRCPIKMEITDRPGKQELHISIIYLAQDIHRTIPDGGQIPDRAHADSDLRGTSFQSLLEFQPFVQWVPGIRNT